MQVPPEAGPAPTDKIMVYDISPTGDKIFVAKILYQDVPKGQFVTKYFWPLNGYKGETLVSTMNVHGGAINTHMNWSR